MKKSNEVLLETDKSAANKHKRISCNLEDGELESQTPIHHPIQLGGKPSWAQAEQKRQTPWKKVDRQNNLGLGDTRRTEGRREATYYNEWD